MMRLNPDKAQKKDTDAGDIIFILTEMQKRSMEAKGGQSRWVTDYNFGWSSRLLTMVRRRRSWLSSCNVTKLLVRATFKSETASER